MYCCFSWLVVLAGFAGCFHYGLELVSACYGLGCCLGFVIALLGVWFDVRGLPDRFVFLGLVWYRF